jgi:hypothetical protein
LGSKNTEIPIAYANDPKVIKIILINIAFDLIYFFIIISPLFFV